MLDTDGGRRVPLRVEVDHEDVRAGLRQCSGEIDGVVVLPTPPFWFAIVKMRVLEGRGSVVAAIACRRRARS